MLAAIVQTWPLALHAADRIVITTSSWGWSFDTLVFLWNLWWVKEALVVLQTNPYHTDFLFYPQGSDLYLHTIAPVNGVMSIPLQLVTGNLFLSWNILALLYFALSGLGMYALCYRITRNNGAAIIAGYMFTFTPIVLIHFSSHWSISTTWPIPFFMLFLLRLQDSTHWGNAVAAGGFWALITYNNFEYGIDAGLFFGIFLLYWSFIYIRRHDQMLPRFLRHVALVAAVWLGLTAPLLGLTINDIGEYPTPSIDEYWSADLEAYVTPSPLWGPGMDIVPDSHGVNHAPIGGMENTAYLGGCALLLAAIAVFAIRRKPALIVFWLLVFFSYTILALGPYLYVGGSKVAVLGFSLPMPYQILDNLPLMGARRAPTRIVVFGICGLSVLAAIGFDLLSARVRELNVRLAPVLVVLVLGLVVLELWNPPLKTSELARPAVLEEMSREEGEFTVLHAPWGRISGAGGSAGDYWGAPLPNYYQTVHERRSFGGLISRAKESAFDWVGLEPGLNYLSCVCEGREDDRDLEAVRSVLRRYRIKYIVVHRLDPYGNPMRHTAESLQLVDDYIRGFLALTPVSEDSSLTVFRNPEVP